MSLASTQITYSADQSDFQKQKMQNDNFILKQNISGKYSYMTKSVDNHIKKNKNLYEKDFTIDDVITNLSLMYGIDASKARSRITAALSSSKVVRKKINGTVKSKKYYRLIRNSRKLSSDGKEEGLSWPTPLFKDDIPSKSSEVLLLDSVLDELTHLLDRLTSIVGRRLK